MSSGEAGVAVSTWLAGVGICGVEAVMDLASRNIGPPTSWESWCGNERSLHPVEGEAAGRRGAEPALLVGARRCQAAGRTDAPWGEAGAVTTSAGEVVGTGRLRHRCSAERAASAGGWRLLRVNAHGSVEVVNQVMDGWKWAVWQGLGRSAHSSTGHPGGRRKLLVGAVKGIRVDERTCSMGLAVRSRWLSGRFDCGGKGSWGSGGGSSRLAGVRTLEGVSLRRSARQLEGHVPPHHGIDGEVRSTEAGTPATACRSSPALSKDPAFAESRGGGGASTPACMTGGWRKAAVVTA